MSVKKFAVRPNIQKIYTQQTSNQFLK